MGGEDGSDRHCRCHLSDQGGVEVGLPRRVDDAMKWTGMHASIGLRVVSALHLLRHVGQIEVNRERAGQRRCCGDVYGIENSGSCGRVAADG